MQVEEEEEGDGKDDSHSDRANDQAASRHAAIESQSRRRPEVGGVALHPIAVVLLITAYLLDVVARLAIRRYTAKSPHGAFTRVVRGNHVLLIAVELFAEVF